jgi:hypothetical protein
MEEETWECFHLGTLGWEPGEPGSVGYTFPVGLWANSFTSPVFQRKTGNLALFQELGDRGWVKNQKLKV